MTVTLPGVSRWLWHFLSLSIILKLPGASLWLWHFLGSLYDCDTSCGLSMIVALPVASYDCDTSLGLYDCDTYWVSLWLWHLLGLSMIVTLPGAFLWLWHFLGPFYDSETSWGLYYCNTSWGLSIIVKHSGAYDYDTSWGLSVIVALADASLRLCLFLGLSMIVTLSDAPIWLWHFLGPLCWKSKNFAYLYLVLTVYGLLSTHCRWYAAIYDCGTSWGLSMIVNFLRPMIVLWYSLGPLYDCETHSLGPLYECASS